MKRLVSLFTGLGGIALGLGYWQQHSTLSSSPALIQGSQVSPSLYPKRDVAEVEPFTSVPKKAFVSPEVDKVTLHRKLQEWQDARASDSEDEQDRLMKELGSVLTDDTVADVLRSLSPAELATPFGLVALHRWMQVDPIGATTWTGLRAGESASPLTSAIAEDWSNHKDALLVYIDHLPNSGWKEEILRATGLELSMKDPEGAISLAQRMKPGVAQTELLQAVVCDWISLAPNAALNWIIDVNEPGLREQLTSAAAKSYALTEPKLAASWLMSTVTSQEIRKEAILTIVETWSARDPESAAKWVTTTLDGETQKVAVDIISGHWMKLNSSAATAWLQGLPKGDI